MRKRILLILLIVLSLVFSAVALAASLGGYYWPSPGVISGTRPTCGGDNPYGFWLARTYTGGTAVDKIEVCAVASPTATGVKTPSWHVLTMSTADAAN